MIESRAFESRRFVESVRDRHGRPVARSALRWCMVLASVGLALQGCTSEPPPATLPPDALPPATLPPDAAPPPYDTCVVDADCGFGEIDHEIAGSADCPCIYGCPYLPLAKATIERRQAQYDRACDLREDGSGKPCGIDDCALAPSPACVAGKCTAAR